MTEAVHLRAPSRAGLRQLSTSNVRKLCWFQEKTKTR